MTLASTAVLLSAYDLSIGFLLLKLIAAIFSSDLDAQWLLHLLNAVRCPSTLGGSVDKWLLRAYLFV